MHTNVVVCYKTLIDAFFTGIKNKHAFLDLLLLSEINGEKIDEESVREEVDTFMFEVWFYNKVSK